MNNGKGFNPKKQREKLCTLLVQALASQGDEIALEYALVSTYPANQLIVSPLFRGSNPYPCGSLTYRKLFNFQK
jgi:hypothetical protein